MEKLSSTKPVPGAKMLGTTGLRDCLRSQNFLKLSEGYENHKRESLNQQDIDCTTDVEDTRDAEEELTKEGEEI